MEKGQVFDVEIDGVLKQAELLEIVEFEEKNYALYFTNNDDDTSSIFASEVVTDEEGYDDLVDIEDPKIKDHLLKMIHEVLNK